MLKERIRKWLGIWGDIKELEDAYGRLKNMYESNRLRIDALKARADAADAQMEAVVRLLPQSKKRGRPAKKPTTKKKGK